MRAFMVGLAVIVPIFAIDLGEAATPVPSFDIAKNCQSETAGALVGGSEGCKSDETRAKNQLVKRWSSFKATAKGNCISESSTGGEQSYVELLTCLEMESGQYRTDEER